MYISKFYLFQEKRVSIKSSLSAYVCPSTDLQKFTVQRKYGYKWGKHFYAGHIHEQPLTVSWRGNASLDWVLLMKLFNPVELQFWLYKFDSVSGELVLEKNSSTKDNIFLLPSGQCKRLGHIFKEIGIESKDGIELVISDPNLQPSYRRITGDVIYVGSLIADSSNKEEANFFVKTTIVKKRPEIRLQDL